MVRAWNDELRSWRGQCERSGGARCDWVRLPSALELGVPNMHRIFAFLHLLQFHAPRPADWAKPLLEEFRVRETVYLCHFSQDIGLHASISWGQMFSQAQTGNPAAAGQIVLYHVRWNHFAKISSSLAKASVKCSWTIYLWCPLLWAFNFLSQSKNFYHLWRISVPLPWNSQRILSNSIIYSP